MLELDVGALEELDAITELLLDSATLEEDAIALDEDAGMLEELLETGTLIDAVSVCAPKSL